jgi:hypothetical protein
LSRGASAGRIPRSGRVSGSKRLTQAARALERGSQSTFPRCSARAGPIQKKGDSLWKSIPRRARYRRA